MIRHRQTVVRRVIVRDIGRSPGGHDLARDLIFHLIQHAETRCANAIDPSFDDDRLLEANRHFELAGRFSDDETGIDGEFLHEVQPDQVFGARFFHVGEVQRIVDNAERVKIAETNVDRDREAKIF